MKYIKLFEDIIFLEDELKMKIFNFVSDLERDIIGGYELDETSTWNVINNIIDLMSKLDNFDKEKIILNVYDIINDINRDTPDEFFYFSDYSITVTSVKIFDYFKKLIPDLLEKYEIYKKTQEYNL